MSYLFIVSLFFVILVYVKNGAEDDLILPCSFAYLQPFFRYRGSKYLKTTPSSTYLGELLPQLFCPRETQFPVETNILNIFWSKWRRPWNLWLLTNFFQKQFFFWIISKTVRDIQKGYSTKIFGLIIHNSSLHVHILVSPTVFEKQGFEKSQKQPPTTNFV